MIPNDINIKLDILSGYMGCVLTPEQKEFASDFTKDTISFSDPGTGKTHTLIAGLIMAQTYHKVQGKLINCMSFTNAAVNEMASRYNKYCKKCNISPTVVFNTFHSLSRQIMKDAYPRMTISGSSYTKDSLEDLKRYMEVRGINSDDNNYVRKVMRAINNLNSSLTFHPDNVERRYDFVELNMDLDVFQQLRTDWFLRGITMGNIVQGDIPLYCLFALMRNKEIISKWKGKYKIMVVDEFQDLSLLHLRILSYIAETLIVIGDMKQQIYAFNGACPQIVREYLKLHPNANVCNLTNSFRCSQAISEYATNIIKPNDRSINAFTGHNRNSEIKIIQRKEMDWKEVAASIEADVKINGRAKSRDTMFLYRNNASAIPVIEELYQRGIPFRCSKYMPVMDVPIFSSLSKLVMAAWKPESEDTVKEALKVFPEFKNTPYGAVPPPVQAMQSSYKDFFNINYRYKEQSSRDIIEAMRNVREAIKANKTAGVIFMKLMDVYDRYIYKNEWWTLDNTKEFYMGLVAPICNVKTFPQMYSEELDKINKNEQAIQARFGIRCYTMHSAKGLEADDVYILDADEGMFPNQKVLKNKVSAGCLYDAAVDVRSERNLLYVAITRAKDNVTITYSGDAPAKIIVKPDDPELEVYNTAYAEGVNDNDDAEEFFKLFNI